MVDLESTTSKTSLHSSTPDGKITVPDGGRAAWLQVLGAFFVWLNSWGVIGSFGEFQTFYTIDFLRDRHPSSIAWIGSTQACLLLLTGVVAGPLYDMGYLRHLLAGGSLLAGFGFIMTSLCKELWQLVLAQGLCVGIGCGLMFLPSVAVMTQYFSTKRAAANGLASIGSGIGGIIYPLIFNRLQPRIGFGWTVRTLGLIVLTTQIFAILLLRNRVLPPRHRAFFDTTAFTDIPFLTLCVAAIFVFAAIYIPLVYLPSFAIQNNFTSVNKALYLLAIINAASIFGRIIPAILADRWVGIVNMQIIVVIVSTILLGWWGLKTWAGVLVYSIFSGFAVGAGLSISALSPIPFCPSMEVVGGRLGITSLFSAAGILFGTPVAGALVQNSGSYVRLQVFGLVMLSLGFVLSILARLLLTKGKIVVKV